jgi:sulfur transfer complex TusBCD TusB component (DsrH family)
MPTMSHALYILSHSPDQILPDLLPPTPSSDTAVLIQDALRLTTVPFSRVYVLADNQAQSESSFPRISYADLVRMIFEADKVVVL